MFNSTHPTKDFRNYDGGLVAGGIVGAACMYAGMHTSQFLGLGNASIHLKSLFFYTSEYLGWASSQPLTAAGFWTIPVVFGITAGYLTFAKMASPRPRWLHESGTRFYQGKEAIKQAKLASKTLQMQAGKNGKPSADGIEIQPGILFPVKNILQSIMCVGAQGTGKTTIINQLLKQLIARKDHKLLIFDPAKGDFTRWVPGVWAMLSVTDKRSANWWLGFDVRNEDDAVEFAAGIIKSGESGEFWAKTARAVLIACICKLQAEKGENWSWSELNELAFSSSLQTLIEVAAQYYPPASRLLVEGSRMTDSILGTLSADLLPVRRISQAMSRIQGKRISLKKWMLSKDASKIIVQMDQAAKETSAALSRAIINLLATQVASLQFSERDGLHCGFILDEIPQFGRLESISKLMEIGRSKGVYTIFGFQDWAQINQIYQRGESDKWDALFGLKIITGVKSEISKNRVMGMLGDQTVIYTTTSSSGNGNGSGNKTIGRSLPTARKPVNAQELGGFGLRKGGVEALFIGLGADALALKISFPDCEAIRPSFKPHTPSTKFASLAELKNEVETNRPAAADPEFSISNSPAIAIEPTEILGDVQDEQQSEILAILSVGTAESESQEENVLLDEVENEVSINAGSGLLESVTGIDSHVFEAAAEMMDFDFNSGDEVQIIESQPQQTIKKRRSRRPEMEAEA